MKLINIIQLLSLALFISAIVTRWITGKTKYPYILILLAYGLILYTLKINKL